MSKTANNSQWRGHLTLPHNTIVTITSDDKDEVVKAFQQLARQPSGDDSLEFSSADPMTTNVFNRQWNNGQTPVGYINQIRVPSNMSVQRVVEDRLQEQKIA